MFTLLWLLMSSLGLSILCGSIWAMWPRRVILLGFQGAGADYYEDLVDTAPLLYAGHVGVQINRDAPIWGFTPYAPHATARQVIDALKAGATFPGMVQDDRAVFIQAAQLWEQGIIRTPVYQWVQRVPNWRLYRLRRRIHQLAAASPLTTTYGFPKPRKLCYNCATWPTTVGLTTPESTGQISVYISALRAAGGGQLWQP